MTLAIVWIVAAIILVLIEAMTVTMVSLWFAIGALGALAAEMLGFAFWIQVTVFIILSTLTIIIFRPLAYRALKGNVTRTNTDAIIGKHAIVIKTISPMSAGEVKIKGRIWRATSLNNEVIQEGSYGEVVAIEGAHVVIRAAEGGIEDVYF